MIKYTIVLLMFYQDAIPQDSTPIILDSLKNRNFDYFEAQLSSHAVGRPQRELYANAWLRKAKQESNCKQIAMAYKAVMYTASKKFYPNYTDSILATANRCGDNVLLGDAYLTKGIVHYERREIAMALDNYLLADNYISKTKDYYLIHKVKYGIGMTKYYLGFYHEAVSLFRECRIYFAEENDRAYLNSLHMLGLCYNRLNDFDSCSQINRMGLQAEQKLDNRSMHWYFIHSEGVNQYFKGNYKQSLQMLLQSLPHMKNFGDTTNEAIANFYIAKCFLAKEENIEALPYLKKVDEAFAKENYLRPDLRESYELLINHFKAQGDRELQLLYINKLLNVDEVLNKNYRGMLTKIFSQYDTKKLISSRTEIERSMKTMKIISLTIIALLISTIAVLIQRHFRNKKRFRKKYEELINKQPEPTGSGSLLAKESACDISPAVTAAILKQLQKFEDGQKFLEKDMNLGRMAELMQTNTKYVSKIIQRYRGKGTIEYISDLKIDHIVQKLKTDTRSRNYTNKALADDAGFGSTQNFTRAFKARYTISPTYYIEQLKKDSQF